uniref:Kinetochore protein Nuf2 N-terminal domain-containing protein n=1 Tax=Rhodnius prolixus TaxID=13249 RepID=T1IBA7_RHOPR
MEKLTDDIKLFFPDFEVTVKDLHTPSPIFVRDFYIRVLIELDVDDENVRKIQLSQNCVDQEEVEIISELNLVTALKAAFPFIDVGLTDLLSPNQKRTCQLLRNILNYLSFADERLSTLNPHLTSYQHMKEKVNELKKLKEASTQESNDFALQRNHLICRKKEVEEKLNEVRNKLQSIFQEGNDINSKKKLAAGKLEEREMFRLSCIQELEMKERQIEELKSEIVNHPEIDENKLKQKENQFTKLNDRRQEIKAGIKDKKNQKSKLKTILEMVNEELLPVCVDIADEIKENRWREQQLVNQEKEIKSLTSSKEGLARKLIDVQGSLESDENRKRKLQEEWLLAEAEVKNKYPEKLAEFKVAKKESSQAKKKLDEANKRIEDTRKKVIENKKMFEELNNLLNKKEEEEDDWVCSFIREIKPRLDKFDELKNALNELNEE